MGFRILLVLCFVLFGLGASRADPTVDLPGLQHDAQAYVASLTKRFPAGGTPTARRAAEQQAVAAIAKQDWPTAATALEARIAQGDATAKQFLTRGWNCLLPGWRSPIARPEKQKSRACC
jgi:alpha-2-macroglobulin